VVFGNKSVHARFCPLSLHCACLFLPLLPASSVFLICLSYLPPLPYLPFLPPLLPLLPASPCRAATRLLPALLKPPKLMPSVVVNVRTPALSMPGCQCRGGGVDAFSFNSTVILCAMRFPDSGKFPDLFHSPKIEILRICESGQVIWRGGGGVLPDYLARFPILKISILGE
jgi:hypothetical protein